VPTRLPASDGSHSDRRQAGTKKEIDTQTQTSWKLQITCLRAARTGRQAPNNKQIPNSNKRNPKRVVSIIGIWILEFICNLGFEFCNLISVQKSKKLPA